MYCIDRGIFEKRPSSSYLQRLVLLLCCVPLHAGAIEILVPAYANPCCANGPQMWTSLIDTASINANVTLHVVFNPASGPGTAVDGNYLAADGTGPLADISATNAVVYGYVSTVFGARDIQLVKDDIDRYLDTLYPGFLDGMFFDEMTSDLASVGYYRELSDYVKLKLPGSRTIGNAGVSATTNPSAQTKFTVMDYADSVDVIVTFENFASEYASERDPEWLASADASSFANLIPHGARLDPQTVSLALSRKVGLLYITEDTLDNPWDSLTSFWPQLTTVADTDEDTVVDEADNCTLVANADQRDTNADGYGNPCDADLDNDGTINFSDLGLLKMQFFTADPDADLDGDGAVNFVDLAVMKAAFFGAPGPSGIVTAVD